MGRVPDVDRPLGLKNPLFAPRVPDVLRPLGLIPQNVLLAPKMESSTGCESFEWAGEAFLLTSRT